MRQIYITLRDWETEINWLKYVYIIYSCWNESSIIGECFSLLHLLQELYVIYVEMSRHADINCLMWQDGIRQVMCEWQIIFLTVVMCHVFVCSGGRWGILKEHNKTYFCVCVFICFGGEWDILKEYDKTYFRVCVSICEHVMWQTDQASGVGAECVEGHRAVKWQGEPSGQFARAYNAPAVFRRENYVTGVTRGLYSWGLIEWTSWEELNAVGYDKYCYVNSPEDRYWWY